MEMVEPVHPLSLSLFNQINEQMCGLGVEMKEYRSSIVGGFLFSFYTTKNSTCIMQ